MAQYRKHIERPRTEDKSVDGMFLTILDSHDEVYGYCIAKKLNYFSVGTYCSYIVETDSLNLLEDNVDTEYLHIVIATTEERIKMLDALRAYGYKWNFQKRQIIDG